MASLGSDSQETRGSRGRDSTESWLNRSLPRSPIRDMEETEPLLSSSIQDHLQDAEASPRSGNVVQPTAPNVPRRQLSWRQFCCSRIPKGKAVFLVLVVSTIETFAFYGAVDGISRLVLQSDHSMTNLAFSLSIILQYSAGRVCYPLTGFLADVYFGRCRVIHISLWLFWMAFGILAFAFSLNGLAHVPQVLTRYVLPIIAFVLISLGSAGVEANILPFGVDQLPQGATSEEISSYFYWWYITRKVGSLLGIGAFVGLFLPSYTSLTNSTLAVDFELRTIGVTEPMIAVVIMTVAILLHVCCEGWYSKDKGRENPIKLVVNVLMYAAFVRRQPPRRRRAHRYGETRKPRIELAKEDYDGIFSSDEVEDVKTFCRIVLIILSLTGFFASYSAVSSEYFRHKFECIVNKLLSVLQAYVMMSYQVNNLVGMITRPTNANYNTFVFPNLYIVFNCLGALVYLPLINNLILPCLPSVSMKKRLGCGVFINLITFISAAYVQWGTSASDSKHTLLWLLIPGALLPLVEVLIFVTGELP